MGSAYCDGATSQTSRLVWGQSINSASHEVLETAYLIAYAL
jgi:hypothetical protein